MANEKKKITETTLSRLQPKKLEWFIKDTEQIGFQIKILPSGKKVYMVEARTGGKGKVKKFKIADVSTIPLKTARLKAQLALSQIREGYDPKAERNKILFEGIKLLELKENYIATQELKPSTLRDNNYALNRHFKAWQSRRVKDITKQEVLQWYQNGRKTPTQTQGAYRILRRLMNYARSLEIIDQNPCDIVKLSLSTYKIKKKQGTLVQ